ncbi:MULTISPECIES: CRISPR-associated protein Csx19 [unclassified Streptomyces]|uniref:type III-D CRISPR-associated protein Csx19 n=1 Tax=unclassified Streptomyces TaxID=2593676 RepID=UPI000AC3B206|nr:MULTISPECIES: CRISPR-associated protein Csx19 [unclassified Streptomyces]
MITLYSRAASDISLSTALDAVTGLDGAVAFLSTPREHITARVRDGRCHTRDGVRSLDTVFEARIFDEDKEVRWLSTSGHQGRAVALSEEPGLLPDSFPDRLADLSAAEAIESHYLLWGQALPGEGEWTTLHTPQIGTLHVPFPAPEPRRRLRLAAREYVCAEPEHGNAYVGEERLVRIEQAPAEESGSGRG